MPAKYSVGCSYVVGETSEPVATISLEGVYGAVEPAALSDLVWWEIIDSTIIGVVALRSGDYPYSM